MQNEKIWVVPFEMRHFWKMPLRDEDAADLAGVDPADLAKGWEGGMTLLYKGQPAFIYGALYEGGEALIWAVTSPLVDRLPLTITRVAKGVIDQLWSAGAHRIMAHCHKDNQRSLRWLGRLGFAVEGLMRKCGPNAQDRYLMAMVREDV